MLQSKALQILSDKISNCSLCEDLQKHRKEFAEQAVPGHGSPNAWVFIVGEAPGKKEVISGKPFTGKSGETFFNFLKENGIDQSFLYLTNLLKCKPPDNRKPQKDELSNCRKFLEMQIKCVNPDWIICLGKTPATTILNVDDNCHIDTLRGKIHDYQGRNLICTYHPTYMLYNPKAKSMVKKDLQPVISALINKQNSV